MTYRSQTRSIQSAVASLGHDPGPVDGHFGAKTAAGVEAWLAAEGGPKPATVAASGAMKRIHWHWTAGGHAWNALAAEHYHFGIDGAAQVHEGDHTPEDNISTADNDYAAHTYRANTGAIGVAVCAMAGASEVGGRINWGSAPMLDQQINGLIRLTAELCDRYGIPVTRETVLSHAEVEPTLGIAQRGKWDIRCLPGDYSLRPAVEVGDVLRDRVRAVLKST